MARTLRICIPSFLILLCALPAVALAQSSSLKLGEEQPADSNTLDLGSQPAEQATTNPQNIKRTSYGDWEVACATGDSNCAMAQVGNDSTGTPVLEMVIRKLPEPLEVGERTAIAVLDVITPLGVVLTEGLSVTIDKGRTESAPFQICTEQGCLVREPIDQDLINRFKGGGKATVSVIAANQGEVSAVLSLRGFTKAYENIK